MVLKVSPRSEFEMTLGEECPYDLDLTDELGDNTVASHTFTISDSSGGDVTSTFGGGSSESAGIITFGVIALSAGEYALQFIVTCNEFLPDSVTPNDFYVDLTATIV